MIFLTSEKVKSFDMNPDATMFNLANGRVALKSNNSVLVTLF